MDQRPGTGGTDGSDGTDGTDGAAATPTTSHYGEGTPVEEAPPGDLPAGDEARGPGPSDGEDPGAVPYGTPAGQEHVDRDRSAAGDSDAGVGEVRDADGVTGAVQRAFGAGTQSPPSGADQASAVSAGYESTAPVGDDDDDDPAPVPPARSARRPA